MKINLWYSKGMEQWRWTLCEESTDLSANTECHFGQREDLRDAMNDVANTVEYLINKEDK